MKKKSAALIIFTLFIAVLVCISTTNVFAAGWTPPTSFTVKQCSAAPAIDGNFNAAQWGDPVASYKWSDGTALPADLPNSGNSPTEWLVLGSTDNSFMDTLKNTTADLYMMWDSQNLYWAAVTTSPAAVCNDPTVTDSGNIWQTRCIQMQWPDPTDSTKCGEIGIATANDGKTYMWQWSENAAPSFPAKVVASGNTVTYEMAIPWTAMGITPSAGLKTAFTYSFNLHSNYATDNVFFCIQFGGSMMNKAAANLLPATLSGDLAVAPTTEAPATTAAPAAPVDTAAPAAVAPAAPAVAPTTGDNTVAIFAVMTIAAAGFVIFRKRFAVK